jgi:CheY-like chemotaxis protein
MTDLGLEVKTANNGKECIQLFKKWKPDLIWMDRRMPVMGGEEATRHIRGLNGGKKVKIIAVTASAFKEQQDELLEAGLDGLLIKPYPLGKIYDSLEQQLGLKFLYRESPFPKKTLPKNLTAQEFDASDLANLPDDLRSELDKALCMLDREAVQRAIDAIRLHNPASAERLESEAQDLQFGRILRMVRAGQKKK